MGRLVIYIEREDASSDAILSLTQRKDLKVKLVKLWKGKNRKDMGKLIGTEEGPQGLEELMELDKAGKLVEDLRIQSAAREPLTRFSFSKSNSSRWTKISLKKKPSKRDLTASSGGLQRSKSTIRFTSSSDTLHGDMSEAPALLDEYTEIDTELLDQLYFLLRSSDGLKLRNFGSFRSKRNCFKGFELIMWLMTRFGVEEGVAVKIGKQFHRKMYFHNACDKSFVVDERSHMPFKNSNRYYQFYADDAPNVLNAMRLWTEQKPANRVIKRFASSLFGLITEFRSENRRELDYTAMLTSKRFRDYVEAALELQTLALDELSDDQRKSLFLNIYNGMAIHAIVVLGHPQNSSKKRTTMFTGCSYRIDNRNYTLHDIKHAMLRDNSPPPGSSVLSKHDPRLQHAVELDPRIHFALSCGTRSCPPLRVYNAQCLDMELQENTETYLRSSTVVVGIKEEKDLLVSRVFGWFPSDFGSTIEDIAEWIKPYIGPELAEYIDSFCGISSEDTECSISAIHCGAWDFRDNQVERAVKFAEELDLPTDKENSVVAACPGFIREPCGVKDPLRKMLASAPNADVNIYKEYFYETNTNKNYIGEDPKEGPVAVSIVRAGKSKKRKSASGESKTFRKYRILIRTVNLDSHLVLAGSSHKELFESLKSVHPFVDRSNLRQSLDQAFSDDLLEYEDRMITKEMKFGVLCVKPGQNDEDEIISNCEGSELYESFLRFIGDKIELAGWKGYEGGLDVSGKGKTGTHSVYSKWEAYEIMFHVCTLLPFDNKDEQQIMRKRHIANDAVVIVFLEEEAEPFNPRRVSTKYTQVYIVVQPVKQEDSSYKFQVGVSRREAVPDFGPVLPETPLFDLDEIFQKFLLSKLVNGLRVSFRSPNLAKKIARSKEHILQGYLKKYNT